MGDWLPPTDYTGKNKKILRKTIGSLISIIDNPDLAFKITYRSRVGFEVRLNNGCFYDLYEQNDMLVEPNTGAKLFEYDLKYAKIKVYNGYSMTSEPFYIFGPISNEYNHRSFFFIQNGIEMNEYGQLVTYNLDIINNKGIGLVI